MHVFIYSKQSVINTFDACCLDLRIFVFDYTQKVPSFNWYNTYNIGTINFESAQNIKPTLQLVVR